MSADGTGGAGIVGSRTGVVAGRTRGGWATIGVGAGSVGLGTGDVARRARGVGAGKAAVGVLSRFCEGG